MDPDNLYPDNLRCIRELEFPSLKDNVFLDHTGCTLYTTSQINQYAKDLQNNVYANPHSSNQSSNLMSDVVHQVRCAVLAHFNVTPNEYHVVFTSGATDALKLLGKSFCWTKGKSKFVYLEDNHTSVVGIREAAAEHGASSVCLYSKYSNGLTSELSSLLSSYKPAIVKEYLEENEENFENEIHSLFAYPAQSNFSGYKYPLSWIDEVKSKGVCQCLGNETLKPNWSVLLDAASFVATSQLDLSKHTPDFVCLSFYKMFGFPTGLGALLVRCISEDQVNGKKYFGGGAADGYLARQDYYKPRRQLHARLEDGTLPFLNILALKHSFDAVYKITGQSMIKVQLHTFTLIQMLYKQMMALKHINGSSVIKVYCHSKFIDSATQGAIIAFNIMRADGSFVGFHHVLHLAASFNIHMRGGCFCNVGACMSMLGLDPQDLKQTFEAGHACGDHIDLVKGYPVGALRVSLGYMTTKDDIDQFLHFLHECFMEVDTTIVDDADQEIFYDALTNVHPRQPQVFLKDIFLYPVKSCRAMRVSKWDICETGLKYDRSWMVVNDHGVSLTLKREHRLALIQPHIDLEKSTLSLHVDGFGSVVVPLLIDSVPNQTLSVCQTKVCGDRVTVFNCGDEAKLWLSEVLQRPVSLVFKRPEIQRFSKKRSTSTSSSEEQPPTLALTNEAQYLMVSQSTAEYLQQIMVELQVSPDCLLAGEGPSHSGEMTVDTIISRFRSNFVIGGAEPFTEESWSEATINRNTNEPNNGGRVKLHFTGLCNRCSMVCIDANTGKPTVEPLRTLGTLPPPKRLLELTNRDSKSLRRSHFGVYFHTRVAFGSKVTIKTGSPVTVNFH
ncbi:unnamed protein product [Clavelina lepadiformis]|uniref:Molybdenum cofactor sulfurase n=1 Tax=Clavelina lepadiformis TaxID=159417 RepID=A0ABP0F7S7_CLALP